MGDAPVMDYLAPSTNKYKYHGTTVVLSHLCCIVSKDLNKKYSFITSNILVMDDSGTKAICPQKADLTGKGVGKNVNL